MRERYMHLKICHPLFYVTHCILFQLIDGLTGERSIYKRRGEKEPDVSTCIMARIRYQLS